ncbi:MAG TPA: glycine betaine ABC transporter substrate-binding protein, partial [Anaeromyxobacter sp.]
MSPLALALALAAAPAPAAEVRVGSKAFAESIVLGEMAVQLARAAGAPAVHRPALGGTRVLWEALLRGDVDLYPDYTGTLAREILSAGAPMDEAGLRAALAVQGVGMTRSLGFEDKYAIGVRREVAERLGLARISDLSRAPDLRLGFTNEFMDRGDGWPALRERYRLPHRNVRGLDHDLAYRAVAEGAIDVTDVYTTDPEIRRLGLVLLEDDRHAFPEYHAVLVYRADLPRRAPAALAAARRLEGALDMVQLAGFGARKPAQLSGGQQQRIAVARALVFEPKLVLMDEPLGALDKQLREQMQLEVRRLHQRLGVTMVYVTHDQHEALTMSDRIAVFHRGKIQQLATPAQLYETPVNAFVARFIGENNRFDGALETVSGSRCSIRIAGDACIEGSLATPLPVGARVT